MGVVVVFGKKGCEYCSKAVNILQKIVHELREEAAEIDIAVKIIDCQDGARAAQCMQLTGKRTVPHIFINEKYLGDASAIVDLECKRRCELKGMIRTAAAVRSDFPPPAEAAMVKVTETLAISSQPTRGQVAGLAKFGLKSLINVCGQCHEDASFPETEEAQIAKDVNIEYYHTPFGCSQTCSDHEALVAQTQRVFDLLDKCAKPALVHCSTGRRACFLVLLYSAKAAQLPPAQVAKWSIGLGHDFEYSQRNAKMGDQETEQFRDSWDMASDWMSQHLLYLQSQQ